MKAMFIPQDYREPPFIVAIDETATVIERVRPARAGCFVPLHSRDDDTPVDAPKR